MGWHLAHFLGARTGVIFGMAIFGAKLWLAFCFIELGICAGVKMDEVSIGGEGWFGVFARAREGGLDNAPGIGEECPALAFFTCTGKVCAWRT